MQRAGQPVYISALTTSQDVSLQNIKAILESSYWANNEGVFQFQFLSDSQPLTNTVFPHQFQLVRYTPDINNYESYETVILGQLNNDGTFLYGAGRLGALNGNSIAWADGASWKQVNYVPRPKENPLDLRLIQSQAYLDSKTVMGDIYNPMYLY
jgi:hypothetical protein